MIQLPTTTFFMQNEPKHKKAKNASTSLLLTTNDQRLTTREAQNEPKRTQNEPKRTQNEPNHKNAKNERNFCYNRELRRNSPFHPPKKQTQSNPIFSRHIFSLLDFGGCKSASKILLQLRVQVLYKPLKYLGGDVHQLRLRPFGPGHFLK